MKDAKQATGDKNAPPKRGSAKKIVIFAGIPLLISIVCVTIYFFVPGAADTVSHLIFSQPAQPQVAAAPLRPQMVDVPEMVVTLPNGGRTRQLRIKFSLELTPSVHELPPAEVFTPRVNDALLTYLRTLRDGDLEGGLALDRIRGDLYRRLTLIMGPGVLDNVLITSLVTR
jgi:flagellar FliL protein